MNIPILYTDNPTVDMAFRIAVGDFVSNIAPFQGGVLKEKAPVMLAGLGYDTPWTRDGAINTWNCGGLLAPEAAKNTLLATVICDNGRNRIGGEYWDAIIWAIGAYSYVLYNGDAEFRNFALDVIENSLVFFEKTEFDSAQNLFRGGACYADGISAYPDIYCVGDSGIQAFAEKRKDLCVKQGVGIPVFALSTNCLYYRAYQIAAEWSGQAAYKAKAEALKAAINRTFWNQLRGLYDYLADDFGGCDAAEALGQSFAILFGIADSDQTEQILKNMPVMPQGVPCLYPNFQRYEPYGYGRHSGPVWPHVQTFWADACAKYAPEKFCHELETLSQNAVRDGFFSEIYHPYTGERYGGVQEWQGSIVDTWKSEKRQMWCATGYIRMILFDLLGMRFAENGITVSPMQTDMIHELHLYDLPYQHAVLNLHVDFSKHGSAFISTDLKGINSISI